ncbi:hypothetical protein [Haloarchaeobius baliensis]|uniref:hypothetical protein n=1 Tax=Haloarchaeobius baliensis TaxID=1670458 RepID=UPI003F883969
MRKHLTSLALYATLAVIQTVTFLNTSGETVTFTIGIVMGVALVGITQSALKLYRPDRYEFVYEAEES